MKMRYRETKGGNGTDGQRHKREMEEVWKFKSCIEMERHGKSEYTVTVMLVKR